MANPGGIGTKFVSVNLNKSYGPVSHHHPPYGTSSHGQLATSRVRPGSHGSGGGGGGGMVVLSRPRSSQKVGPKLSVPSPLNLPSLRKEHERFDLSGSGGGSAGSGGSGSGSRPNSSGLGWTKPGTVALQEKDGNAPVVGRTSGNSQAVDSIDKRSHAVDAGTKESAAYMPPSARLGGVGLPVYVSTPLAEKTTVLKGEDFPSLQAALPSNVSGPVQKQKDSSYQKQKQVLNEESLNEQIDSSPSSSLVRMRPQGQSAHNTFRNISNVNDGEIHGLGTSQMAEKYQKKQECFPGPLPLVWLNPRSDWADDERDTGHGFADRGRDNGYSKTYWDREFDLPRSSVLPHKPSHNQFERWGKREDETRRVSSSEIPKVDLCRDVRPPSREGKMWKTSTLPKDGFNAQSLVNDRSGNATTPMGLRRATGKDINYTPSHFGDKSQEVATGNQVSSFGRRDVGDGQDGRYQRNQIVEASISRVTERNTWDRYGSEQSNRYKGDALQNSSASKSSFSLGVKGLPMNDPILNFGREKHSFSKSERPYVDDQFMKEFGTTILDDHDPFSVGLVGVIKRKKDVVKQTDFHDPVRESFEAELERVQKMQELERQRIIEEQERALEQARKEEEERQRLIREEEERQRRLENEAQEAAWRAEQERLEAIQRAEEQKIAREEEKQRIVMEEERRKQAAKQKLLELEARIAKRQAEAAKGDSCAAVADENGSALAIEKDGSRMADLDNWEDSEKMVERITTSGSSDSSGLNRSFDLGPRSQSSRHGSSSFLDRVKPTNSWRKGACENGNGWSFLVQDQDNGHHSPGRDASVGGRVLPRKELYGGAYTSSRTYSRVGVQDPHMEDFTRLKGHWWNVSGDGDPYSRNRELDPEFHENLAEPYGDLGWGLGRSHGIPYSPYPQRLYSEADEPHSHGRSRYSMRQPRVLPPPSLVSVHKASFRGENERPGPSTFPDNDINYNQTGYYGGQQERNEVSEIVDVQPQDTVTQEQKLDKRVTPRCDSQSSVSVSSPPNSPTHLSHDDLDESGDSLLVSAATEGKEVLLSGNESAFLNADSGKGNVVTASDSISAADDEDWTVENTEELQEQEEYDEDEDGYQEEDEVHDGDDENIDLTQEFEDLHLEEKGSSRMMDNLVLGFDEGVEVGIPSEGFERSPGNKEGTFWVPEVSVGIMEERGPVDGMEGDGQLVQPLDSSPQMRSDGSSMRPQEAEEGIHDSITQPINAAPHTLQAPDLLGSVDGSSSAVVSSQHIVASSVDMASYSSSGQTVLSNVPVGSSQADLPVKLQFGLFSGAPLIPSPVPAIQIGSIQMPLHLHPPLGTSLTHLHPSQPPFFQFGQLRYTSSLSQGILPTAPQAMSFVQPSAQAHHDFNQSSGGHLPIHPGEDGSTHDLIKDDMPPISVDAETTDGNAVIQKSRIEISHASEDKFMSEIGSGVGDKGCYDMKVKSYRPKGMLSEGQFQAGLTSSQPASSDRVSRGSKLQGPQSGAKGRKFAYSARSVGIRSSFPATEASRSDTSGFQRRPRRTIQRTEFRVRENVDRRQSSGLVSFNNLGQDEKSNFTGSDVNCFVKSGSKDGLVADKPLKQIIELESSSSVPIGSQGTDSETRLDQKIEKEALAKPQSITRSGEGNLKRNLCSEEDVDAPLQSGIVCIFKQPGIEAPSDEDDFIEVRSKRQMLNDRREQREKEIKAKTRIAKVSRKPRSTAQTAIASMCSNKISIPLGGEEPNNVRSDFIASEGRGLMSMEVSTGCAATVSQPLAPIGTPAVSSDAQADKRPHNTKSLETGPTFVVSNGGKNLEQVQMFETKNKILHNVKTSLGSWGNARINQQVMTLTQTQLDEAMKPDRFDTHVASIGDHACSVTEPVIPSSSIMIKDKSFSSTASPINSLLAGEKIQFGAVTSPSILPPSSRTMSHGIGAPGSCRSDIQISHNLSAAENDCTLFFAKDKHQSESCSRLEDSEAEAEAAASAVAVAAITSDEIIGSSLGTCSVSVSDTKSFGAADISGISRGMAGDQQLASNSRAEEALNVALPADLSVETPPISLWPPLPSPQNSSSQILSHFPGGPPSHFPFYEMNPMLGGPIFTFGPHDESAVAQSQSQKSAASSSGLPGTWQQCRSGVDSFYSPPTGFAGPYISPPGGIPGVQGPPHMVVYNHFPVGQFGQVGLSIMGTTYIPSGKQPDWKHNPTSSAMGMNEGDMSNINMVSAQRSPPNMAGPASIHHLAPGSQLLPMASPLAMFDVSPFQSSPDMSVQGRWSHVPATPLHSVPLSMPLQQPEAGVLPSQFIHGHPIDQSPTPNRLSDSRTSPPSGNSQNFPMVTDVTASRLPGELGLVDSSSSTGAGASTESAVKKSSSGGIIADVGKTDAAHNGSSNNGNCQSMNSFKTNHSSQQKNFSGQQQYFHSAGNNNYQRGGGSQKHSLGGDWSHRRVGFHGRNHSGTEKSYSKMKQIYVAKQTASGTSTCGLSKENVVSQISVSEKGS